MPMNSIKHQYYRALVHANGWLAASAVAERCSLPLPAVRLVLREQAAVGRVRRDVFFQD
jgi:hypothetical protein